MLIPQLTFTRFLAAISIVIVHYGFSAIPFAGDTANKYLSFFTSLVTYFFVLSGFILVVSNYKEGQFPASIDKKKFWKNRFARIYPLYLFAIIFLLFSLHYGGKISDYFGWNVYVVYTVLLVQSWEPGMALYVNYPSWSLSVEAFFYLLFPFLFQWLKPYVSWKAILIIIGIWFVNILIYGYLYENKNVYIDYFYYYPPLHFISFVIGVSGGFIFLDKMNYLKEKKVYLYLVFILLFSFVIYSIYNRAFYMRYYNNGMLAPLYLIIIYIISLGEGFVKKILVSKPLIYLGEISYGIYLLQCPLVFFVSERLHLTIGMGPTKKFYLELLILIIFSAICHEVIEKPMRKYLRRL